MDSEVLVENGDSDTYSNLRGQPGVWLVYFYFW